MIENYKDWEISHTFKNGDYADEYTLLKPSRALKRDINEMYSIMQMHFGQDAIHWNGADVYPVDTIVSYTYDVNGTDYTSYFVSLTNENSNNRPDNSPSFWRILTHEDVLSGNFIHIDISKIHSSIITSGYVYLDNTDGFYKPVVSPNASNILGYLHFGTGRIQTSGTIYVDNGNFTPGEALYLSNAGKGEIVNEDHPDSTIRAVGVAISEKFVNLNFNIQDAGDVDTTTREYFDAVNGQTTFTTTGYRSGYIDVYMNGVKLSNEDFIANNGSTVELTEPAVDGDQVDIISYGVVSFYDLYTREEIDLRFTQIQQSGLPIGSIIIYNGLLVDLPSNWTICDGQNGTPDLRDKFVMGGTEITAGTTGGSANAVVVSHTHTFTGDPLPEHTHDTSLHVSLDFAGGSRPCATDGGYTRDREVTVSGISAGTPTGTISTTGEDGTGKNLPPYYKLIYIQRIA